MPRVFTEKGLQEPNLDLLIDGTEAEVVELDRWVPVWQAAQTCTLI